MSEGITASQLQPGVVTVLSKTVELTNAQIKALPTSSVEIVPSPGPGKRLRFISADAAGNWFTADKYTNIGDEGEGTLEISFYYGAEDQNASAKGHLGELSALLGADEPTLLEWPVFTSVDPLTFNLLPTDLPLASVEDKGISLVVYNSTAGNFEGGNPANRLPVTVSYAFIDV